MTDINKLLNTTSAGLLAQKLDAADGTKDGKIEASIWNEFVKDKGGKEVNEFINVGDAMNSITKYAIRNAKTLDKDIEVLAKEWTEAAPTSSTAVTGSVAAGSTTATTTTPQTPTGGISQPRVVSTNAEAVEADYQSVKVTVPLKTVTAEKPANKDEVDKIQSCRKDGKRVAELIKKANANFNKYNCTQYKNDYLNALKQINKDNVIYVLGEIPTLAKMIDDVDWAGAGFDKDDVIKYVLTPLGLKGDELGWVYRDGEKKMKFSEAYKQKAPDWSIDKIYRETYGTAKSMRGEELKKITEYNKKMTEYNNDVKDVNNFNKNLRSKAQKTFDDATKFMAEVANMNSKPEIERGHNDDENCDFANATLPDGRRIVVLYDNDGKISYILISHDTTPDTYSDGTTQDCAEVSFNNGEAYFDYDKSNENWEGSITSGYDFEKLKALAEKIFGKKE